MDHKYACIQIIVAFVTHNICKYVCDYIAIQSIGQVCDTNWIHLYLLSSERKRGQISCSVSYETFYFSQTLFVWHHNVAMIFFFCHVHEQFEADRRAFIITINSFGTELTKEDRAKLFPRCGQLDPYGLADLAKCDDYDQVRAVADNYPVSVTWPLENKLVSEAVSVVINVWW